MMEEVSVMMAYDANLVEQMSEEEILASLVEETGPKFTVRLTVPGVHLIELTVKLQQRSTAETTMTK